jgi:hypothetical protein
MHEVDNNHLDEKTGRALLRLELEALKKGVLADSPDERTSHITHALTFRKMRSTVYTGSDSTENILELKEGLAEYTGMIMSGRDKEQTRRYVLESLDRFLSGSTFVRSFAYLTIPLYGYLLCDRDAEWNKHIDSRSHLAAYFQRAFDIHLPEDIKAAVEGLVEQYNGKAIFAEEAAREETIKKPLVEQYKKMFIEQPHLVIPCERINLSFNPSRITPLEDKGKVYGGMRATDNWGILTVEKEALVSAGWDKITVSAPTSFNGGKVSGDGWTLELHENYSVQKDDKTGNYVVQKRTSAR